MSPAGHARAVGATDQSRRPRKQPATTPPARAGSRGPWLIAGAGIIGGVVLSSLFGGNGSTRTVAAAHATRTSATTQTQTVTVTHTVTVSAAAPAPGSTTTAPTLYTSTTGAMAPRTSSAPAARSTTRQPVVAPADDGLDPRFTTCKEAKANGYGHYRRGVDPEYAWYRDADHDGVVCE